MLPFGRTKGNIIIKGIATLRVAQFAAAPPRRTATRPKARAALRRRRTASLRTLKSHKNSPKTRKITKKARKLLYDTIICTTFGTAIRRERRESRCCYCKRRKFTVCDNKRMSQRVVNHVPIGEYIEHCAMTGVGLLCYEVRRVSYDLR